MSENTLYALKKDDGYLRKMGHNNEYSTLKRAWLLSYKSAVSLLKYYPDSNIVKIKLEELEE